MTTITAYHGSEDGQDVETIRWYTTDLDHARSHGGEVRAYALRIRDVLEIDADVDGRLVGVYGYDADEILQEILSESDADAVAVSHYEGAGLCILVDPRSVTVEELPVA